MFPRVVKSRCQECHLTSERTIGCTDLPFGGKCPYCGGVLQKIDVKVGSADRSPSAEKMLKKILSLITRKF